MSTTTTTTSTTTITTSTTSTLPNSAIYTADLDRLKKKLTSIITQGHEKLKVVSDFDSTLSLPGWSSWCVIERRHDLSDDYRNKIIELTSTYHPKEIDPKLSLEEKITAMIEWRQAAVKYLSSEQIPEDKYVTILNDSHDYIKLRPGAEELLRYANKFDVPVLIFSAGLADFIDSVLHTYLPDIYKPNNPNNPKYYDHITSPKEITLVTHHEGSNTIITSPNDNNNNNNQVITIGTKIKNNNSNKRNIRIIANHIDIGMSPCPSSSLSTPLLSSLQQPTPSVGSTGPIFASSNTSTTATTTTTTTLSTPTPTTPSTIVTPDQIATTSTPSMSIPATPTLSTSSRCIIGLKPQYESIHVFNKNEGVIQNTPYYKTQIAPRTTAIVIGDSLGDATMVANDYNDENVLRVAFLNLSKSKTIETHLQRYLDLFDIVFIDTNIHQGIDWVHNIMSSMESFSGNNIVMNENGTNNNVIIAERSDTTTSSLDNHNESSNIDDIVNKLVTNVNVGFPQ